MRNILRTKSSRAILVIASLLIIFGAGSYVVAVAFLNKVVWEGGESVLVIPGTPPVTLYVSPGSQADTLVVDPGGSFTVSVAAGSTFIVRWPGTAAGTFVETGLPNISHCSNTTGSNILTVTGSTQKTFTLDPATVCAYVGHSGASVQPYANLSSPNGGEALTAGQSYLILWGAGGTGTSVANLKLSTDGGSTFSNVLASGVTTSGYFNWTVPAVPTSTARIKIEILGYGGSVLVSDTSDANFTITGTSVVAGGATETTSGTEDSHLPPSSPEQPATHPPAIDPTGEGTYDPGVASVSTPDIDTNLNLRTPSIGSDAHCAAGTLVKGISSRAVYYCGQDGKRHVFLDQHTFLGWFDDFSGVVTLSDADLALIPLGSAVTGRPGKRMVKIQSDPKVYAVSRGGLLRWVTTEATAEALYGPDWNTKIDDINVAFFFMYTMGPDITAADLP